MVKYMNELTYFSMNSKRKKSRTDVLKYTEIFLKLRETESINYNVDSKVLSVEQ